MAPTTAVPVLLLLVGAFCACLAQSEELSLFDVTQGSRSSKASISSYGYGVRVERTCMAQNQVKSCRVNGCEDCYSGLFFTTDFGCCDDHSDYSHPNENLAEVHLKPKVSGCQWDIQLLKEFKAETNSSMPIVPIEEGVYIQLGTATGKCTLTEASDKCEGPYCSDMTITMQGGLYASMAYSKERGNTIYTPSGDLCTPLVKGLNTLNSATLSAGCADIGSSAFDPVAALADDVPGAAVDAVGGLIQAAIFSSTLPKQLQSALAPYCHGSPSPSSTAAAAEPKLKPLAMKGDYYGAKDGVFAGIAVTLMGQTTISSLKHPLKVESTGHMEYTPVFLAVEPDMPIKEEWPTVMGGAMKLWFKSQEEVHEPKYKYRA